MPFRYLYIVCLLVFITNYSYAQDLSSIGEAQPFSYSGNISSRLVFYNASGIQSRRDPFGYVFSGGLNISIYELTLPFTFSYSNQGTSYGQPFNQFGVSPTYKWATAHLGYRNITHSSMTLAGHQMLGAGFDLNPDKLRVSFMAGRLRRAVQFRPLRDSLSLDTLLQIQDIPIAEDPVYKRTGWSAKVGYGDNNGFIDLILFKGKDDASSIQDDSIKQLFRPAENAIIGLNAQKTFFNKLTLSLETALSAYTRDSESLVEGEDSVGGYKLIKPFIRENATTYYYKAIKAALNYSGRAFNVRANYEKIDPDYKSMGAYFFTNDREMINVTPNFYLLKNKVILTSGISYQRDNLADKKQYTTKRFIPRLNMSYNPSAQLGFDLGYQNMRSTQESGTIELTDSTRMAMSNPGFTAGLRYNIMDSLRVHNFMLMLNKFKLNDDNVVTQPFSEYSATILNFNYNFLLVKKELNLNVSLTTNTLTIYTGKSNSFGFSLGAGKGFKEGKVNTNFSWSSNFSDYGDSHSATLGAGIQASKQMTLSLNLNYLKSEQATLSYNEFTGFFECRYTFPKPKKQ
ncbi:hypothetical protein [Fulvivirga ligni]|uniref:hypothetical protein n=1 Tax=Fulvivirga ligni TaxID=2904246 RepID=UPI001F1D898E|nr:hypothetical protein [Fulvivirga ligni]UII23987.1 hypothetical protein LVD16_12235 [Fulvivirga ligni]